MASIINSGAILALAVAVIMQARWLVKLNARIINLERKSE